MKRIVIAPLALLVALLMPEVAPAQLRWQPVETVDIVRGVPAPIAAVDSNGKALIAYSNSDEDDVPIGFALSAPWPALAVRDPGRTFVEVAPDFSGTLSDLAVNPAGATALVALRGGRVLVRTYPPPGVSAGATSPGARPSAADPLVSSEVSAADAKVGVDGAGRVTAAWLSPSPSWGAGPPSGLFAVRPGGTVQELTTTGSCRGISLDVNARGDAALATECGGVPHVFYSPPGGGFGPGVDPFGLANLPGAPEPQLGVALDGMGVMHAFETRGPSPKFDRFRVFHAVRPPGGPFSAKRELDFPAADDRSFALDVQEDGRAVAAVGGNASHLLRVALRPPGGDFALARSLELDAEPSGLNVAAAPRGPAAVAWVEGAGHRDEGIRPAARRNVGVTTLDAAGAVSNVRYLAVPGDVRGAPDAAMNERGQALVTWEQRCSATGGFAVMAAVLDERRTGREPPCQDTRAPKVIAARKRARLVRRSLRVRIACDERCALTASARILRNGGRRPIAKAKTARERGLRARRGATVALRLSRVEVARVRRAVGARGATLKLSVSVRDVYGSGRVWRLRLPIGR